MCKKGNGKNQAGNGSNPACWIALENMKEGKNH